MVTKTCFSSKTTSSLFDESAYKKSSLRFPPLYHPPGEVCNLFETRRFQHSVAAGRAHARATQLKLHKIKVECIAQDAEKRDEAERKYTLKEAVKKINTTTIGTSALSSPTRDLSSPRGMCVAWAMQPRGPVSSSSSLTSTNCRLFSVPSSSRRPSALISNTPERKRMRIKFASKKKKKIDTSKGVT